MKRIVVKIGSQVLCNHQGLLNQELLASLVRQVATLRKDDWQVLIVSSGAVAAGKGALESENFRSNDPVTRRQVLAASGQVRLMQTYHQNFEEHGFQVAQVLASKSDFQTRSHYLNMRNCLEGILDAGIIPVVNENDVVSITELMFTDNDELAGLLAGRGFLFAGRGFLFAGRGLLVASGSSTSTGAAASREGEFCPFFFADFLECLAKSSSEVLTT